MYSSDQEKKCNKIQLFFSFCGERKGAVTIRVTIHLSMESFPSLFVNAYPSSQDVHSIWFPRPQETPVLPLLVYASKLHVSVLAWISFPSGAG